VELKRLGINTCSVVVLSSREKFSHGRIGRSFEQRLWISRRDHGAAFSIEEDAIVANRKETSQFVSDYYNRRRPDYLAVQGSGRPAAGS
jgi:hypothetical protein